jgi:hypothetical protein
MAGRAERAFREDMPMEPTERDMDPGRPEDRDLEWDRRGRARRAGPPDYEGRPADERRNGNGERAAHDEGRRDRRNPRMPDPYAVGDTYVMALKRSADLVGNNVRTIQDQTTRFVSRRMERDMEAMEEIARSRSLLELFGIQQKWLSGVASDYSDEMIRLARLAGSAIEDSVGATNRMRER